MWLYNLRRKPQGLGRKQSFLSVIMHADPVATIENRQWVYVNVDFPVMMLNTYLLQSPGYDLRITELVSSLVVKAGQILIKISQ